MKQIIPPIAPELIEQEFTPERLLCDALNGGTKIYSFTAHEAPNAMRELGRLRELAFREAGGGTGKELDIDAYDTCDHPYRQLVVWDPQERQMLGGYRYDLPPKSEKVPRAMATSKLFKLSDQFQHDFLPYTIELGRSFVHPIYQQGHLRRKGLFALDNLWDGLGALLVQNPNTQYFFGKVTMYPHYNREARNALLYFLGLYFPDRDELVSPMHPLELNLDIPMLERLFSGDNYAQDLKKLERYLNEHGEKIPPLIKSYMGLTNTMRVFGTSLNPGFGAVEETGILVKISDIKSEKIERYVERLRNKIPSDSPRQNRHL